MIPYHCRLLTEPQRIYSQWRDVKEFAGSGTVVTRLRLLGGSSLFLRSKNLRPCGLEFMFHLGGSWQVHVSARLAFAYTYRVEASRCRR